MEIPPNSPLFNFHQRKRPKTTQPSPSALPSIHVHNHLPGSSARIDGNYSDVPETTLAASSTPPLVVTKRSSSLPLTTVKKEPSTPLPQAGHPEGYSRTVIDLTNSDTEDDEDFDGINYPRVSPMLAELAWEYPDLRFPDYEDVLIDNGFMYVTQLVGGEVREQLRGIGISIGVVNLLMSHAERLVCHTRGLKQEV